MLISPYPYFITLSITSTLSTSLTYTFSHSSLINLALSPVNYPHNVVTTLTTLSHQLIYNFSRFVIGAISISIYLLLIVITVTISLVSFVSMLSVMHLFVMLIFHFLSISIYICHLLTSTLIIAFSLYSLLTLSLIIFFCSFLSYYLL